MDTVLLLDGGHRVHLSGIKPTDISHDIDHAREVGENLLYIQAENYPDNGVAINAGAVVAVIAKTR